LTLLAPDGGSGPQEIDVYRSTYNALLVSRWFFFPSVETKEKEKKKGKEKRKAVQASCCFTLVR
jgi:hypothetical protein